MHGPICNYSCFWYINGGCPVVPDLDVSIRDLRLVLEVAERRSFTEAAEAVHLSQSALSRAVNDAERRLGARLFSRTTRSVTPTPVGEEFVRTARAILAHHERRLREFALFRDGLGGVVRGATLPSVAATLLPALVAALKRDAPGVVVDIDDTLAHDAIDQLLAGRVDFAITVADGVPDGVEFTRWSATGSRSSSARTTRSTAERPFAGRSSPPSRWSGSDTRAASAR